MQNFKLTPQLILIIIAVILGVLGFTMSDQDGPPVGATPTGVQPLDSTPTPTSPTEEPPIVVVVPTVTAYPTPSDQQRIINPSFEGEYMQVEYPLYDGSTTNANEIHTPAGWLPYYCNQPYTPDNCDMKTPEFAYADLDTPAEHSDGGRVHSGERAAKWFCTSDTCKGGLYQVVQTIPGERCTVKAWVQTWNSQDEGQASESSSADEQSASVWRIKVNKSGDVFGFATENESSIDFGWWSGHYDRYTQITFVFIANSYQATIFIENERLFAALHNDSYLDDVTVHCVMPSSSFPNADSNSR
jgi:hypothetical protein